MNAMQVCIPGGNKITSSGECKKFQWQMNGKEFIDDMVIIPIRGCDMVLGIQWLKRLGNIMWNFDELKMVFTYNKDRIVLRGAKKAPLQWIKGKQLDKNCAQQGAYLASVCLCVYPVTCYDMSTQHKSSVEVEPQITQLLEKYADIFKVPTKLPPKRSHEHRIPLKDGTFPINVRPYRNPPAQKDAIETMVAELLDTGFIRASQSPFSAPILMVKKKDGS
ncbi:uncharacterized protein [Rutidosis leptorrhynchoides]|uniref:uncharacterized protein n=1 Tax=Rutidosis leptorrhynchoides TaxID=125765 RepID=UPI003A98D724